MGFRILAGNLLPSVAMLSTPQNPAFSIAAEDSALESTVLAAIAHRYGESGAESYGIPPQNFQQIVAAVAIRYTRDASEAERLEVVATLRIGELVLARACTFGNEHAWDVFLARFRASLYETAYRIAKDEATGRELADGLYAELYGIPNREGRRISKLDYYMGRGSLEGWLRTVLARQHIDRCRTQAKDVSLEEQIEAGVGFAASSPVEVAETDDRVTTAVAQTLAEVGSEERFLLASYFLDQRTLANIGRQLGVHESTISRKLEKLTGKLRKRLRKRLQTAGINPQRCEELLLEIDVRDLNVNVADNLRQESPVESF
jgi:RNA polymerase sigma-70 factor (ECF subfamily)